MRRRGGAVRMRTTCSACSTPARGARRLGELGIGCNEIDLDGQSTPGHVPGWVSGPPSDAL